MKLIIIILIIMLLVTGYAVLFCASGKPEFYYMTSTGYSNDPRCISDKWRDGLTATGTPIRKGVIANNVDWINNEWRVRSPLRLGQKIYIEGAGQFSVEDTGYFTDEDYHFDYWNLDIFYEDYEKAKAHGVKRIKVIVLKRED